MGNIATENEDDGQNRIEWVRVWENSSQSTIATSSIVIAVWMWRVMACEVVGREVSEMSVNCVLIANLVA